MKTVLYGPEVPSTAPFALLVCVKDPDGSWRTWFAAEAEPGDEFDVEQEMELSDISRPTTHAVGRPPTHVTVRVRNKGAL